MFHPIEIYIVKLQVYNKTKLCRQSAKMPKIVADKLPEKRAEKVTEIMTLHDDKENTSKNHPGTIRHHMNRDKLILNLIPHTKRYSM